ncbi:MAG: DUF4267 domain-containing protein [Chloroflexota bacterium]
MNLRTIFQGVCILFCIVMLYLAYMFWTDFESALEATDHTLNSLGYVLAGRFVATALLALFVAFYRDMRVMAFVFILYTWMSFVDGYTYFIQGLPHLPHTGTGILCLFILAGLWFYRRQQPDAFK